MNGEEVSLHFLTMSIENGIPLTHTKWNLTLRYVMMLIYYNYVQQLITQGPIKRSPEI